MDGGVNGGGQQGGHVRRCLRTRAETVRCGPKLLLRVWTSQTFHTRHPAGYTSLTLYHHPPSLPPTWHRQLHALGPDEGGGDVLQLERREAVQLLVDALEDVVVKVPGLPIACYLRVIFSGGWGASEFVKDSRRGLG